MKAAQPGSLDHVTAKEMFNDPNHIPGQCPVGKQYSQ